MFCEKCGTQIIDGTKFCIKCGAPVSTSVNPRKKLSTGAIIGIIAGVIAVVLVILALCGVFGGARGYRSQEDLFEDYFDAVEDRDYHKLVRMFSPDLIEYASEEWDLSSERSLMQKLDDWYYDYYGLEVENWHICEVDEYDRSDIQELREYGVDADELIDVYVLARFEDGNEYDIDFDLAKVNGKWYIIEIW